ncbi:MAG TPA: thiolase [Steroidobacteraceae bacterium]
MNARGDRGFPRGQTAIVGTATFGMGEAAGFTAMEIAVMASVRALESASLKPSDVDALFVCLPDDYLSGLSLAEYLGIHPKVTDNNRTGGSSFLIHVMWAALALQASLCDVALIAYGSTQRSGTGRYSGVPRRDIHESPYKPKMPVAAYALAAARHMHVYGTTQEQLAEVAVSARRWAQLNPDAFERGPLSIEDVLKARRVADPFGVRDCCLVTDGAGAVVMTRADRARDLPNSPAYVLAAAASTTHMTISSMPDLTVTGAAESGARAYSQARVRPCEIDVLQLYDAFTINPILFLEDLGFCPKGEGGPFVSGGRIAPGGALPVNTNGGGLSCVHPGMYGIFALIESVAQITGRAGERQIKNSTIALAHGNGGFLSSQATVILGNEAAL